MSLRVYLDEKGIKKVRETPRFYITGPHGERWHLPGGVTLCYEKECCFMRLDEVLDPIPSAIINFVKEFTLRDCHRASRRESGIYTHKTAKAEVIMDSSGLSVSIFIRGKSREDVLDLLKKIKTGTIRPEESYEAPQDGMSSGEIRAKLAEDIEYIKKELEYANTIASKLRGKIVKVSNYAFSLKQRKMPILPQTVINKLESIFDPPILSTSIHK